MAKPTCEISPFSSAANCQGCCLFHHSSGQQSHNNQGAKSLSSTSTGREDNSRGTQGGSHDQHVKAGSKAIKIATEAKHHSGLARAPAQAFHLGATA
ncbi:hypothetical protein [Rhizobium sp. WYCCWR 11146]|uniref:hypothetical protein n=1 Tax=Rhizobium sp. WYCCWR 11146 TaxID=2749833 RepID=UPI0015E6B89F|nr:hypothetical protein [Rhizobium sp. WYCCWR 11146]MBA1349906.1 hypothetical protein [Rhizobium sp. WYCCWR 11146]